MKHKKKEPKCLYCRGPLGTTWSTGRKPDAKAARRRKYCKDRCRIDHQKKLFKVGRAIA